MTFAKLRPRLSSAVQVVNLFFDSLTVGRQAEGKWKAAKAIEECHLIRSIMRLCESRFGVDIQHEFCPSHRGEPGNELADQLAHSAALGYPLQVWAPFFEEVHQSRFVQAMEWAWILFLSTPWCAGWFRSTDLPCQANHGTHNEGNASNWGERK